MEWLIREENASALEKVTVGVPWLNVGQTRCIFRHYHVNRFS